MRKKDKKNKKNKKKLIIIAIIVVIVLAIFINLGKAKRVEINEGIATENIEKRTIMKSISATGTIKASNAREYTTTLMGKEVKDVKVKVGDKVNPGDTLVVFDTQDLNENLKLAQDGLNIAKDQTNLAINAAEKGVNTANDSKNSQYANLDKEIKNIETNIGNMDSQIAVAQNALNLAINSENMEKAKFEEVKKVNEPIMKNYNEKKVNYSEALKALEDGKNQKNVAETEYNKLFSTGGLQLNTGKNPILGIPVGGIIPPANYQDAEYATEEHRTADTTLSLAKKNVTDLENKVGEAKLLLDGLQAGYDIAKAQFDAAEFSYKNVNAQKMSAEKGVNELKNAKEQLNASYEKAKSTADTTKKSLDSAVENAKTSLESSKLTAKSTIMTQENQIKNVKEQIEKGVLKSDVSGTVTKVNVKDGDSYQGGTVIKVEGCETFIIESQVDEYDIADVKVGMKVKIKTDATRKEELEGVVTFVAPTATETSAASPMTMAGGAGSSGGAKYKVEISINSINERLRIGMTAKLSIITEEAENALTIPYDAIEEKEDGKNVIKILEEDGVSQKEIEVTKGLESDYYTEIKSDKIKEGMKVVVPDSGSGDAMSTLINTMQTARGF